MKNLSGAVKGDVFNPEKLLSDIIDKIKEYNTLANNASM